MKSTQVVPGPEKRKAITHYAGNKDKGNFASKNLLDTLKVLFNIKFIRPLLPVLLNKKEYKYLI